MPRQRSEHLPPGHQPATVNRLRDRAEGNGADGGCISLREWLRIDRTLNDDLPEVQCTAPLVLGPCRCIHLQIIGQRTSPQRGTDVHVPGERRRTARSRNLSRGKHIGAVVRLQPPMPPRDAYREQPGIPQVVVILRRKACITVMPRGARGKSLRAQSSRTSNQVRLLSVDVEGEGIEQRGIKHIGHPAA